jgi:hypothetical protein
MFNRPNRYGGIDLEPSEAHIHIVEAMGKSSKPDSDLNVQHPNIQTTWFIERLKQAAGAIHSPHWNRWAAEHLTRISGTRVSEAVLTRRLKGRKKWPLAFTLAVARLLKVDIDTVIKYVGEKPPKRE